MTTEPRPALVFGPVPNKISDTFDGLTVAGASGAELAIWNDHHFSMFHLVNTQYSYPTEIIQKNSAKNLINFFKGEIGMYDGIMKDMRVIIFSMTDGDGERMFEYCFKPEGVVLDTVTVDSHVSPNPNPSVSEDNIIINEPSQGPAPTLAEDAAEAARDQQPPRIILDANAVTSFWKKFESELSSISAQGNNVTNARKYYQLLSLYCLFCFKLISKNPDRVANSISNNLIRLMAQVMPNQTPTIAVAPPHLGNLMSLKQIMGSSNCVASEIMATLIGRLMIERSKASPDAGIEGALLGSCLLHTAYTGLPALKHLDQAALSSNISIDMFCKTICTSNVKNILYHVSEFKKYMARPPGKIILKTTAITPSSEISWRWCRFFNNNHFSRFGQANANRLIIRCLAFISQTAKGDQIENMAILQSSENQRTFLLEKTRAANFMSTYKKENDVAETEEAQKFIGTGYASSKSKKSSMDD